MARHQSVCSLSAPQYDSFSSVSRCVHFADFHNCWEKKALVSRTLMSKVVGARPQVLWFAPMKGYSEHNFYGNMTFSVDFNKLLNHFAPAQMFYIDQIKFNSHMVTRILLTRGQSYSLQPVNTSVTGSPIMRVEFGSESSWQHVTSSLVDGRRLPHELEIALQPVNNDCSWLFKHCRTSANNHSRANTSSYYGSYAHHVCHRFNTFRFRCPHSLDEEKSVEVVRAWVKSLEENDDGKGSLRDRDIFALEYKKKTDVVYDNSGWGGLSTSMSFFSL
ncbi:hypothetical protein FHG87_015324 [Trinorchestia longiramus]|nr:hypothetical protein FHG87_015324 [Trinorchestia longiramus]